MTLIDLKLTHLEVLEAEAIHVMREVAAELERPVLLFSGGKDSIVLLRLAEKAFRPARFPFPLMHVDTGHNFPEVIEFRDRRVAELGERLIVARVQDSIDAGRVVEETGPRASRNRLQTTTLLDAIAEHGFDAAFGGARRDEERARAKERIMSFRDDFGGWDPQGPASRAVEPLQRAHPQRRARPRLPAEQLDRARRVAVHRAPRSLECRRSTSPTSARSSAATECSTRSPSTCSSSTASGPSPRACATARWATCRAPAPSPPTALALEDVVAEIAATKITERGETRADDKISEAAMEDRKVAGYF